MKRKTSRSESGKTPGVNLYLVGFMATGKSTVGRALASRIGYRFCDSDAEIERRTGLSIPQIFEMEGEETFRRYEREFIEDGHPDSNCIVACGGGLVAQPGMTELLKKKGVVICLFATPETILKRTSGNRNRPLLNVDDPEKQIRDLMEKREPFYRRAGTMILTDNRSLSELVEHVQRVYLREAKSFLKDGET
ncbi:MAG TPA: shikimate kinase [Opitutales bacterium]|nr:shikimate kinase [Opitutales bacterium]